MVRLSYSQKRISIIVTVLVMIRRTILVMMMVIMSIGIAEVYSAAAQGRYCQQE